MRLALEFPSVVPEFAFGPLRCPVEPWSPKGLISPAETTHVGCSKAVASSARPAIVRLFRLIRKGNRFLLARLNRANGFRDFLRFGFQVSG